MKAHTKIYIKELGYDISDFMPCELSGGLGVDNIILLTEKTELKI